MHQGVWSCLPNHRASAVPRAVTGAATEKTSSDTGPNAIGSPEADPVVTAVAPTPRPLSLSGNPVLRTDSLDYHLPPDLLATAPAAERSEARLLVACRNRSAPQHQSIANLHEHLRPGDLLVVNTSRVVQARLLGFRTDTGGKVQMLYLRGTGNQWQAFVRTKRVKAGMTVLIKAREGPAAGNATLIEPLDASAGEAGAWRIESDAPIESILERAGLPPLPPYILTARRQRDEPELREDDPQRYQTVFADQLGSVAAPTAGLHLDEPALDRLREGGIGVERVVLHVGSGTFKPIEAEHIEHHPMHAETCSVPASTIEAIDRCRANGGRVFAVGTTTARALESYAQLRDLGEPLPEELDTSILIAPGHDWRWVDGLLTNFHLPRSTLLAMVSSLFGHDQTGLEHLLSLYAQAIEHRYRFYSFGDAMLITPEPSRST